MMGINQSKVLVLGAGVTGIMLYLFFGPNGSIRLRKWGPPKPIMGLKNAGATCFLNSVLQALASCNHFKDWLAHKDDGNRADFPPRVPNTYSGMQYPLIAVIYRSLLVINREIEDDDDLFMRKVPGDVISAIRRAGHTFRTTEEQDTFEFLQFIIGVLQKEVEESIQRRQAGSLDCIVDEEDTSDISGEIISHSELDSTTDPPVPSSPSMNASSIGGNSAFVEDNPSSEGWSLVNDPSKVFSRIVSTRKMMMNCTPRAMPHSSFQGMFANALSCIFCGHKNPTRLEAFNSISLSLPPEEAVLQGTVSLRSMLMTYFQTSYVSCVDCVGCSQRAGQPTKAMFFKKIYVGRLPNTLCIHIARTSWTGELSKRSEHVTFQEHLNLGNYMRLYDSYNLANYRFLEEVLVFGESGDTEVRLRRYQNSEYRLMAVVSHVGDPEYGHFMTYRRGPSENRYVGSDEWFCTSDEMVLPVTLNEVLRTRAYMLLYEKVKVLQ